MILLLYKCLRPKHSLEMQFNCNLDTFFVSINYFVSAHVVTPTNAYFALVLNATWVLVAKTASMYKKVQLVVKQNRNVISLSIAMELALM